MNKNSRNGLWLIMVCSFLVLLLICQIGSTDSDTHQTDSNTPTDGGTHNVSKDPNDPKELLCHKWSAVISVLRDEDIKETVKEKKINKIVTPIFDFPLMAKLSLGRKHWPKLDDRQREKFTQLFSEHLKRSYWKKIALYKDEKILFKDKEKKDKIYLIPTELLYKDKKVDIIYKLRKNDKSWKIYDVEIQGVSILLTYRSQFDEILSHGTVKDLISRLEKPPDD